MKKLFFFKSSAPCNGNFNPPYSKVKETNRDNQADDGRHDQAPKKSKAKEHLLNCQQIFGSDPCLRRSRSYSSGTTHDGWLQRNQSGSPCSSSNVSLRQPTCCPSRLALTPNRHITTNWLEDAAFGDGFRIERSEGVQSALDDDDLTESSSYCSTNSSNKVLDRYIDGEQHQERRAKQSKYSSKFQITNANKLHPRVRYTAPTSPTNDLKQKPKAHLFSDNKESQLCTSSRDWIESGFGHESPRKLAKQVIERLSQTRALPRENSKDLNHPITIEDIYGRKCLNSYSNGISRKSSNFPERSASLDDTFRSLSYDAESEVDVEREKVKSSSREEIKLVRAQLESQMRRLEREKNDLQVALEREIDRRSGEWSIKLEKFQAEERRLRERVRELAEKNVFLQKEVMSFVEKETESRNKLTHSDTQLKDLALKVEEVREENLNLHQSLSETQEKCKAAEEDRDCFRKNYEEREKECRELRSAITRLVRTCSEQDKTIDGLRGSLGNDMKKNHSLEDLETNHLAKLQLEQMRLTGVEQALRKEVESQRLEIDSLRRENINLISRVKGSTRNGGFLSALKLDQEVLSHVQCMQNQGLCLINDCIQSCVILLHLIKEKDSEAMNRMHSQLLVESDVKLQGFKRGAENLNRALHNISAVIYEKSHSVNFTQPHGSGDGLDQLNNQSIEVNLKSDLKAEILLTSLLREKLYSKEQDLEQLQTELAAAVRGNDILKCEVQNALDNLSCVMHKMKDLEIQMIKKDENIYRLQNELQDCTKELTILKGILPKVSEERDSMWEKVKQCSENNMLLDSEVGVLRKKIEALDQDVLLKEGQITILKDALGKPFDLLAIPDKSGEFLL